MKPISGASRPSAHLVRLEVLPADQASIWGLRPCFTVDDNAMF